MKYNTLLVPVVALATLAGALPADYPSDQGKYKPRPKAQKQEQTPFPKVAGLGAPAPKLAGVQPLASAPTAALPLAVPGMVVNAAENLVEDHLPVDQVKAVLANGPPTGALPLGLLPTGALPVLPPTQALPLKALPTNAIPVKQVAKELPSNEPTPGFLPKVPVVRRSHTHVTRDLPAKKNCGHLQVVASDNKFSGFVSAQMDASGRYTVVSDSKHGVLVDLQGHDLLFRDVGVYPALGATYGVMHDNNAAQDNMQGNSANFAMLTATSQTPAGKRDAEGSSSFNDATGADQKIESAIYWFGENNEIHAMWVNTNNQPIPIEFGVNPDREVIMSANVGQYAAMYGGKSARLFCSGH